MKLFVAVVTFVLVSIARADDVMWKSVPDWSLPPNAYVYEGVPVPEPSITQHLNSDVKTQSPQEQPKQTVSSTEQSRTDPANTQTQTPDQGKEEELKIDREANVIAKKENALSDEGNGIQRNLVAIGLITIFAQVFLTLVQIYFIQTANEHAGAAAVAAKESADAVLKQTKVMENQMRPWVMVTPDRPGNWPPGLGVSFQFRFQWTAKNVGGSPAFLTRLSVDVKVVDWPIPNMRPPYPEEATFAKFIIPPSGFHESRANTTLTPDQVERYMSGRSVVAFYGIINYFDAFGPHCTRFYTYWGGPLGMKAYTPVGPSETVDYT